MAAIAAGDAAVDGLRSVFFATPYRPTGLTTDARAVVRLVDELRWLNSIVLRSAPKHHPTTPDSAVCAVKVAAADVLDRSAALLDEPSAAGGELAAAHERMRAALAGLEHDATTKLPSADEVQGQESIARG